MSKECYVTGKKTRSGNNRSHAMNATKRTFKANLQKKKIIDEKGNVKTVYLSTRAMKNGKALKKAGIQLV